MHFIPGFLKPQCSLASPMDRGRSAEACSCFSGMCPLHQRRLASGNSLNCVNELTITWLSLFFGKFLMDLQVTNSLVRINLVGET